MFEVRNMLDDAKADKEVGGRIDLVLERLANGELADRILEAARTAVARHMFLQAQEMRFPVEAENSAQ